MADNNCTLVSIIVPCYNYGHFIAETLHSVLAQTCPNWECIIVDDGSIDNSREVISAFSSRDNRFKYIYQENRGMSAARNIGICAAQGEFLQFLDADDLIEKWKLELQVRLLLERNDLDIVYGDVRYFTTEHPDLRLHSITAENVSWMPAISGKGNPIIAALIKSNIMVMCAALVRRRVVARCGLFDETLRHCEDHEFWLRCAISGMSFDYMNGPDVWSLVRSHPESMSKNQEAMMQKNQLILTAVKTKLYDEDLVQLLGKKIFDLKIEQLLEQMRQGQRSAGFFGIVRETTRQQNIRSFFLGLIAFIIGVQKAMSIRAYIKARLKRD